MSWIMRGPRTSSNVDGVRKPRNVGRAAVPRRDVPPSVAAHPPRPAGKAKVGKAVGKAVAMDRAHTELIASPGTDSSRPVFVDPSGIRRRRLRWLAYLLGMLLVVTLALVWWSQLGGTSRPPAKGPCSAAASAPAYAPTGAGPAGAGPTGAGPAAASPAGCAR